MRSVTLGQMRMLLDPDDVISRRHKRGKYRSYEEKWTKIILRVGARFGVKLVVVVTDEDRYQ